MSLIDPWFYDHRISGNPMLTDDELNRRDKQLDKENEAMTRTYTAADFANARFAEHPDGDFAARSGGDYYPWEVGGTVSSTDELMAREGWVPVPTNHTITDSQLEEACGQWYESDDFLMGFIAGYEKAGGTVLEETTRERVARLVNEIISERGPAFIGEKVADRLIKLGLVKENTK